MGETWEDFMKRTASRIVPATKSDGPHTTGFVGITENPQQTITALRANLRRIKKLAEDATPIRSGKSIDFALCEFQEAVLREAEGGEG